MKKGIAKKSIILSLVIMFSLTTIVYASTKFTFINVGDSVTETSSSKMKGKISLRASHYPQNYNGQLAYTLSKKSLVGYSVISRQQISTYKKTIDVAIWTDCSNAYYKGTLLLNDDDYTLDNLSGTFSIVNN